MKQSNKNQHAEAGEYTRLEMMAVSASRFLRNNELAMVGYGLPMVACSLAKYTHAKNSMIMTEAGAYDAQPVHLPFCVADARFSYKNPWLGTPLELLANFLPFGRIDVGILGGAQVDMYGNLNSTCYGNYKRPRRRLPGSGGAADFACMAHRTVLIMLHEKNRFVKNVDYLTTPGWKCKKYPENKMVFREELGLRGGPEALISTLGIMKFHEQTREMYVDAYFADLDVTPEEIQAKTGFPIDISAAVPAEAPTYGELDVLRTKIDPDGVFIR